jgi:general secretion pathway protein A
VNNSSQKGALVDDPDFLASLADLDRGLSSRDRIDGAGEPARPDEPRATPFRRAERRASGLLGATNPPAEAADPSQVSSAPPATPGRPLLDLFPPPPTPRERARGPALGGDAPPPRIRRTSAIRAVEPSPADPNITYEPFYGLSEKPFSLSYDSKFIYHSTSYDRVSQELVETIARRDGLVLLTGDAGVGKTTMCRSLVDQLDRRTLTSFVGNPLVSVEDLLKTVLVDFGVASREDASRGQLARATRVELTKALIEFAVSLAPLSAAAVVIVDEAQNAAADIFDVIRELLTGYGPTPLLQIVLAGEPTLLRRKEVRSLDKQIALRCRLDPLSADDVAGYVGYRLAVAGTSARVEFDDRASEEIYAISRGVPRIVNQICDRALTLGYEASASVIDEELVEAAASDLDLDAPRSDVRWLTRTALVVVALFALVLAGAGAALWVLQDAVARTVAQWETVPPAPAPPIRRLPAPLVPLPGPEEDAPPDAR